MHVYPFNKEDPSVLVRTKMGIMRDAKQAAQQKSSVDGIKGPCWFAALQHVDIVLGNRRLSRHCFRSYFPKHD